MTNPTENEIFAKLQSARRWSFAAHAALWVVGIAIGLTMVGVVVLATFAQLDAFQ